MNPQTAIRQASPAGLRNHVEKMLKQGHPLANICSALGVTATFVAKVRKSAGLEKTVHGVASSGLFAHAGQDCMQKSQPIETTAPDSPYVASAKADVRTQTAKVAKALRKEDATQYVPRLVKQLIDMGETNKTIFACFTKDQHDLVSETLNRLGR